MEGLRACCGTVSGTISERRAKAGVRKLARAIVGVGWVGGNCGMRNAPSQGHLEFPGPELG